MTGGALHPCRDGLRLLTASRPAGKKTARNGVGTMQILIETLTDSDEETAAALLRLVQSAFAAHTGRIDPPSSALGDTVETLREKLARENAAVADLAGRLVGCVFYVPDDHDLYFSKLAVSPDYQGHGIASRLIGHVERQAAAAGLNRVTLGVRIALPDNVRFFESLGYRISEETTHPGFAAPTSYTMAKRISPPV